MTKKEVRHICSPATSLHFLEKLQPATLVTYRTPPLPLLGLRHCCFTESFLKVFRIPLRSKFSTETKLMIFMINNIFCNFDESLLAIKKMGYRVKWLLPHIIILRFKFETQISFQDFLQCHRKLKIHEFGYI